MVVPIMNQENSASEAYFSNILNSSKIRITKERNKSSQQQWQNN
jgi:hypothetical protein